MKILYALPLAVLLLSFIPPYKGVVRAYELGTYECQVESMARLGIQEAGPVRIEEISPDIPQFTLQLQPFKSGQTCATSWRMKISPYECSASYSATFNPPLIKDTPQMFSPEPDKPDIYFGKNSYFHFADNVVFQASWSEYNGALLARGKCARKNTANN